MFCGCLRRLRETITHAVWVLCVPWILCERISHADAADLRRLCETLRLCVRHKRNSVYFREFCVRRLMARRRHTQNFIAHAKAQSIAKPACDYFLDIRTKEHNASRPLRLCVKKICSYVLLSKKLRSSAKRVSQRKQREAFSALPYPKNKSAFNLI